MNTQNNTSPTNMIYTTILNKLLSWSGLLLVGFLLGIFSKTGCSDSPPVLVVRDTLVDTLWYPTDPIPVPVEKIVWKVKVDTKVDTIVKDSVTESVTTIVKTDSVYIPITVNEYEDSLFTDQMKIRWRAQIEGTLFNMEHNVSLRDDYVYPVEKHYIKPVWVVGAGVSNRLAVKGSVGYKSWYIEPVFNKNGFQEIFLTKQFSLHGKH